MKFFDFKSVNMKAFRTVVILSFAGLIALLGFIVVELVSRHGESVAILLVGAVGLVLFLIKRFFRRKYRVGVSVEEIVLFKNDARTPLERIPMSDVVMIRRRGDSLNEVLHIFRRGQAAPAIVLHTADQSRQVDEMLDEICRHTVFAPSAVKGGWLEYVSETAPQNTLQTIPIIRKRNRKIALIAVAAILFVMVLPFVWMAAGHSEGYMFSHDVITYDGVPIDIDREQVEWLGSSIVKDSTRVYFLGEFVPWADAPTFVEIGPTFFRDRNGIYHEKIKWFSRNELLPLQGDFDPKTLTAVDNTIYKDKDNLYHFDFNLISGKSPLKRLDVEEAEGVDVASFEAVGGLWYRDANWVYFGGWARLRRTEEIDRDSFEVLTWQVAKDRNNVYYMTRWLTTSDERREVGEVDDYGILEGAHAPSFRMTDYNEFEDDYKTWTIE